MAVWGCSGVLSGRVETKVIPELLGMPQVRRFGIPCVPDKVGSLPRFLASSQMARCSGLYSSGGLS